MKNALKISVLLLTASLFMTSCKNKEAEAMNNLEKDAFFVKAQIPPLQNLSVDVVLSGTIKAMDEALIYPRTNGKLVKNILREGDPVKKDETIAMIKRDEVGVVYEPAPVPSTLDGVVGRIYQDAGADVNPQTPIALVVSQKEVRVQIEVPEKYLSQIHLGQRVNVKVEAWQDKIFTAKIDKISPVVDKTSKTSLVEATADNSRNYLKSGMFCEARIVLKEVKNARAVPLSSIVYKGSTPYIYLLDATKTLAVEKKAELGVQTADFAEIRNLGKNDEVITVGLYGLKDGSKIQLAKSK